MAESDIKRELIAEFLVGQVQEIEDFKLVRRLIPDLAELQKFASTQFPVAAVSVGFPVPHDHISHRGPGGGDYFLSALNVTIYVFDNILQDSNETDVRFSDLANALWAKLHEDMSKGGLVKDSTMRFEPRSVYLRPYISFALVWSCNYLHTTGAI